MGRGGVKEYVTRDPLLTSTDPSLKDPEEFLNGDPEEARLIKQEVIKAIESLYDDRLRPFGRILKKRLQELNFSIYGRADLRNDRLQNLVRHFTDSVRIVPEKAGEWTGLLVDREEDFVEVYSQNDGVYGDEMWAAAAEYFATLGEEGGPEILPGGRYASAVELKSRSRPFLEGRSLGEVCHIVQLAVSKRHLLGHDKGRLVAYRNSKAHLQRVAAEKALAEEEQEIPEEDRGLPSVTWEAAVSNVKVLLQEATDAGSEGVPVPTLKPLFRSRFRVDFNEAALGHTKMVSLLQDSRMAEFCALDLRVKGSMVVPKKSTVRPAGPPQKRSQLEPASAPDALVESPLCVWCGSTIAVNFAIMACQACKRGFIGQEDMDRILHSSKRQRVS